jgi:hypothetical protein
MVAMVVIMTTGTDPEAETEVPPTLSWKARETVIPAPREKATHTMEVGHE